jgi:hypothetical protein
MRNMRVTIMMMGGRQVRVKDETIRSADRQDRIEYNHSDRERSDTALHGVSSRTCCTKAIDSGLSHTRGPTARPTM